MMNGGVDPVDGLERAEVEQSLEVLLLPAHRRKGEGGDGKGFAIVDQVKSLSGELGVAALQW